MSDRERARTSASVPPSKYPNPGTSNVNVHDSFCHVSSMSQKS
jgi:hypothetical protein